MCAVRAPGDDNGRLELRRSVTIILPYPPSVNRYWRTVNGRTMLSKDARIYKDAVSWLCDVAGMRPTDKPVALYIHVYRPRRRGDLDNTLKALLDALSGHAYVDDAQVVEIHAWRCDDGRDPRVEVEIR